MLELPIDPRGSTGEVLKRLCFLQGADVDHSS